MNQEWFRALGQSGFTGTMNERWYQLARRGLPKGEDGKDGTNGKDGVDGKDMDVINMSDGSTIENALRVVGEVLSATTGVATVWITDSGEQGGTPLFQDLSSCVITVGVVASNDGTADNDVCVVGLKDVDNTTGRVRFVCKRGRSNLLSVTSPFRAASTAVELKFSVEGARA